MSGLGDDDSLLSRAPRRARPVPSPGGSHPPPAQPAFSPASAPAQTQASPGDPREVRNAWSRRTLALVAVPLTLVLLVGGFFAVRSLLGSPVALEVGGAPIVNAQQMLDDLELQLVAVADADGAPLPEGAGCWFAPGEQDAISLGPRVACGPVRLGIAGDDQLWLVDTPSYQGIEEVRGSVGELDAVAALDLSTLYRPDGGRPPSESPPIGTDGVRTEKGEVLTNVEAYLDEADRQLEDVAGVGVLVADDARCFLGVREARRAGKTVRQSTGSAWCGPARTRDAAPGATWAEIPTFASSTGLVTAQLSRPGLKSLPSTQAVPSGTQLWRPDGAQPGHGALPEPAAPPQPAGFIDVVEDLAEPDDMVAPTDGRLRTPREDLRLTGLARAKQVGEGDEALVAAEGENLVIARYEVSVDTDVTGRSTATLIVDGDRRPLTAWSSIQDGSWLVASVPSRSDAVDLEVVFDDQAQTISLLTGERAAGAPTALLRP